MPSVYTNEASLLKRCARLHELLDRNGDGSPDVGVLDEAIADAGDEIDMRLRQRYGSAVPFAQITDPTPTPKEIQRIARDLVLADLFGYVEPEGRDATRHQSRADTALNGLADGSYDIEVDRAAAHEGRIIAVFDAEDPTFAGQDDDDIARTRGI